jgi:hypothetical protein
MPVKQSGTTHSQPSQRNTPREVNLVVRVDPETLALFDRLVASVGMSRSQAIRRFVDDTCLMGRAGASIVRAA